MGREGKRIYSAWPTVDAMSPNLVGNSILIHAFIVGLGMYLPEGVICMVFSCFVCSCSQVSKMGLLLTAV